MLTLEASRPGPAPLFAALGDPTRLALVARLGDGRSRSITDLSQSAALTRQAITKHLRVLEGAGLVTSARHGRETHFALEAAALESAKAWLERVSQHWDMALERLRLQVEA